MEPHIYGVTEVNQLVKGLLDSAPALQGVAVRGELSNYKIYPSGHHYFTLKDQEGALRCVMFRGQASRLRFRPENGMKAVASGRITVFPRDGAYQLYCDSLIPEGVGDLAVAFQQLKEKLWKEGLFDPAHKKPLPPYPEKIAIVTSGAGAAVHDMIRILRRRYPIARVILLPVRVQGAEAPPEIAGALRYANRYKVADLIITGRGGGSMEDLWAFNEEIVARAIYASEIPVISAVGHEPDVTIADYVADLRAATPSNAAELVVPDQQEVYTYLGQLASRLGQAMQHCVGSARRQLEQLADRRVLKDMMAPIEDKRLLLDFQQRRILSAFQAVVARQKARAGQLAAALDALSPLKVLGRGYSIVEKDGHVVSSVAQVDPSDSVSLRMSDGTLDCIVTGKELLHGRKKTEL